METKALDNLAELVDQLDASMRPTEGCCSACRYWVPLADDALAGLCRTPTRLAAGSHWETAPNEGCEKFRSRGSPQTIGAQD